MLSQEYERSRYRYKLKLGGEPGKLIDPGHRLEPLNEFKYSDLLIQFQFDHGAYMQLLRR